MVARSESALKNLAEELNQKYSVKAYYLAINLCESDSAKYIYDWCKSNNLIINVLVNNAGVGWFGNFNETDLTKHLNIIELNITSLVTLTHYFLDDMKKLPEAYILNVASIVSLYPLPYNSVYAATKAFVLSFTQALRYELKNTGITASCLCPGDTDTGFFENAGGRKLNRKTMSPEVVAQIAVNSLHKKKSVIYPKYVKLLSMLPKTMLAFFVSIIVSKYIAGLDKD